LLTFAYPIPDTPDATSAAWDIQRTANNSKSLTAIAATTMPSEIPIEGLQDCSPNQLELAAYEIGATGTILLGVGVKHKKGPSCHLSTQINLVLLDNCGNHLPIDGNNIVVSLDAPLQPNSPYGMKGISFLWTNWCASSNDFRWAFKAIGAGQEIVENDIYGTARCESVESPSTLQIAKENFQEFEFGAQTLIPIGTATPVTNISPTCVVTATPLATPHPTRTALPTYSAYP
jgi:hypothetical protein